MSLLAVFVLIGGIGSIKAEGVNPQSLRYFPSGYSTYDPGTLFGELNRTQSTVIVQIYQRTNDDSRIAKKQIEIPLNAWTTQTQIAQVYKNADGSILVKKRSTAETFRILTSTGKPAICRIEAPNSVKSETHAVLAVAEKQLASLSPIVPRNISSSLQATDMRLIAPTQMLSADEISLRMQKKAEYFKELNEDVRWFDQKISNILKEKMRIRTPLSKEQAKNSKASSVEIEISREIVVRDGLEGLRQRKYSQYVDDAQAATVRDLLSAIKASPQFSQDKDRANRLLHYLTLYGEFRRFDDQEQHRTLAHLFWSTRTMENRILKPPSNLSQRERLQSINPVYDPTGAFKNWLGVKRADAAMSKSQFAVWNAGDSTLSDIILQYGASVDNHLRGDIVDFISAYEAGLITTQFGASRPELTHYVSPAALPKKADGSPQYPGHWFSKKTTIYKGEKSLPAVIRLDYPQLKGLINSETAIKDLNLRYQKIISNAGSTLAKLNANPSGNKARIDRLERLVSKAKYTLAKLPAMYDQSRIDPDEFEGLVEHW